MSILCLAMAVKQVERSGLVVYQIITCPASNADHAKNLTKPRLKDYVSSHRQLRIPGNG